MEIFTIGFTRSSAEHFFGRIKQAKIERLVDVRLNNRSQLAGFAKRDDLEYFLRSLCNVEYVHEPSLAPTQDILDAYKKNGGDWAEYEVKFMQLMQQRQVETKIDSSDFEKRSVLLCSEHTAEHCHRKLVLDYLGGHWPKFEVFHL